MNAKIFAFAAALLLNVTVARAAATNDLTAALQRGLFEEEANRNLEAAISAYQSLVGQFDKDRQIAATAVFRLGEVFRKQGKTNEAALQYERIVKEFADQQTLATLSRQNLTGLGANRPTRSPTVEPPGARATATDESGLAELRRQLDAAEQELNSALIQWKEIVDLDRDKMRIAVQQGFPNPVLDSLMKQLAEAEQLRTTLRNDFGDNHTDVVKAVALQETILKQIDAQTEGIIRSLDMKRRAAERNVKLLEYRMQEALATTVKASAAPNPQAATATTLTTDDEDQEIRRIQAMIQNSPDLINAPDSTNNTPLHLAAGKAQLVVARFLLDHGANVNALARGRTALHEAAQNGHKAMVELLIERGANVNERNSAGDTPLHIAVIRKYRGVTEALLANKADVNAARVRTLPGPPLDGYTPLHLAAEAGEKALVELLLAKGADANVKTSQGFTPLHRAAAIGRTEIIELLLAAKADVTAKDAGGGTPLHAAARSGSAEAVNALLKANPPVNAQTSLGATPLLSAVRQERTEVVKALLEHKAEPDMPGRFMQGAPNNLGQPGDYSSDVSRPIRYAILTKNSDIMKLLLEHGADPEGVAESAQERPLFQAINFDFAQGVELLLKHKADPNRPTAYGTPALFAAIGKPAIVKLLLNAGAKANLPDQQGRTPLNLAAEKGDKESAEALLLNQADANAADARGFTPLIYATERGTDLVKLLLDHGADVNQGDSAGDTPLHYTVRMGNRELVELLLSRKADVNVRNKAGGTPLDWAKQQPRPPGPRMPRMPQGGVQLSLNTLGGTLTASGSAVEPPVQSQTSIPDLLRQHGARDDLPNLDLIEVRQPSTGFSTAVFSKGTNDWNRMTLFEAVYGLTKQKRIFLSSARWNGINGGPAYPDWHRIGILRPKSGSAIPTERIEVNLLNSSEVVDCAKDVQLAFGDVLEIPEREYRLDEPSVSLTTAQVEQLRNCLKKSVKLVVRGQTMVLWLQPDFDESLIAGALRKNEARRALLSSSDLSRVKVTRRDPATGQPREWVVDCSNSQSEPGLWLRDGDVIEVPEKP